jgi:hypothetical protein
MKFSKILLLLVIAVSIVSCKSDDDGAVPFNLSNANIAGTHDLTYFTASQVITGTVGGSPVTITSNTTADTYLAQVTFTEAGTYTLSGQFRTITTFSDGRPQELDIIVLDNNTGTYQLNEAAQTLVLIDQGGSLSDSDINTVTLFNETELRITFGETYIEDGDEYVEMQELRFVRQ